MEKMLLVIGAILMCAGPAFAQGGSIGLFSDPGGANWCLYDATPGLCNVYVVHLSAPGVTASEWAVSLPSCLQASFISDSSPFAVYIGLNPFNPGKSVGYGACLTSPIHVATISYFCQALTPPCCLQLIIPHLINGGPSAVDCAAITWPAMGSGAYWNPDGTCGFCPVSATDDATWGQVKALYE